MKTRYITEISKFILIREVSTFHPKYSYFKHFGQYKIKSLDIHFLSKFYVMHSIQVANWNSITYFSMGV